MPPSATEANLFEQTTRLDALDRAWAKVRSNGGCAGGDGVTIERFQPRSARLLILLSRALRNGSYLPRPIRLLTVPKANGEPRQLAIPSIIDRVGQTAVAEVLMPILDAQFADASFAYRPGRSVQQAVQRVSQLRKQGFDWVVDGDIERFFDNVPHEPLLGKLEEALAETGGNAEIIDLISLWLEAAGEALATPHCGLAQGSPLSPLLANLYLDAIDDAFAEDKSTRLVRFADDFVILCRRPDDAQEALEDMRRRLSAHGLALHPEKTRIVDFDRGFRFLGHLFVRSMVLQQPAEKAAADDTFAELLRWTALQDAQTKADEEAAERAAAVERAAGLDAGLRVLYVMEPGRRLTLSNEAFAVTEMADGREVTLIAVPHSQVDRIEIGPAAEVSQEALRHALGTETALAFVTPGGATLGLLEAPRPERAALHQAQAALSLDPERRLELAKILVDGRIRNQRALLNRLNRKRKYEACALALKRLNWTRRKLPEAEDIAACLGHEGEATALYWQTLGLMLEGPWAVPEGGRFTRSRQPPGDGVNLALSYLAAMLTRDMGVLAVRRGLHPGFGALHTAQDYGEACVYDLVEEFRAPLAEGLAVYMCNSRQLPPEMFTAAPGGGVRISPEGRTAIIRGYQNWVTRPVRSPRTGKQITWRRLMEEQAGAYAAHMRGGEAYAPYRMDY